MENEIIDYVSDDNVPAIADDNLLRVAEMAERRIDAVIKIKQMALKVTNAGDWVDQNGKPYLFVSGSEKIANLFNISWRIDEPIVETEADGHFTYTLRGVFSIPGRSISAEGSRSSKDPFFKKYDYIKQEGGKPDKKVEKPISAIDRRDVRMAALTNLLGNGITRLLGIRNLSYDDLSSFAGITKEMISKVEYKGKKTPINQPTEKNGDTGDIPEGKENVLTSLISELNEYCRLQGKNPEDALKELTSFDGKDGKPVYMRYDKIKTYNEKWLGTTLGKLRKIQPKKTTEEKPELIDCPVMKQAVGLFACQNCKDEPDKCEPYQTYLDSKRA